MWGMHNRMASAGGGVVQAVPTLFRSLSTPGASSSATVTITKPTGVQANDLLVCLIFLDSSTHSFAELTGWTETLLQPKTTTDRIQVFTRVADGTEGANFTFTATGAVARNALMVALYSDEGRAPALVASDWSENLSNSDPTRVWPQVATNHTQGMCIWADVPINANVNSTPFVDGTEMIDTGSTPRCFAMRGLFDDPEATPAATALTALSVSPNYRNVTLAIATR